MLVPDESLHDEVVASLIGPGLLQQGGLHRSLEDFLRSNMQASWFTSDPHASRVQQTCSGTGPGSPLADLLFQFMQTKFMEGVVRDLEGNLHVKIRTSMDPVHPQGWADDVAILLPMGAGR